jgi:hypothetical protein
MLRKFGDPLYLNLSGDQKNCHPKKSPKMGEICYRLNVNEPSLTIL